MSHCIDLAFEHMHGNETWINGRGSWAAGQKCWLTFLANHTGETVVESRPWPFAPSVSTDLLRDNNVDILSGQLPLGSDAFWATSADDNRGGGGGGGEGFGGSAQFVIFFRRPLERFVSEFMFRTPDVDSLSVEDAVALLNASVAAAKNEGRYRDKYSSYLITPAAKIAGGRRKDLLEP